jgi:hypothetical protein
MAPGTGTSRRGAVFAGLATAVAWSGWMSIVWLRPQAPCDPETTCGLEAADAAVLTVETLPALVLLAVTAGLVAARAVPPAERPRLRRLAACGAACVLTAPIAMWLALSPIGDSPGVADFLIPSGATACAIVMTFALVGGVRVRRRGRQLADSSRSGAD